MLLKPDVRLAGRYRIVRFLAGGGTGEVYEAEDLELSERVALKVLSPAWARDSQGLDRFRRELSLARKIKHPNVCRVFDLERDRSGHAEVVFLTMEFLEGETLEHRLNQAAPMGREDVLPLARQMAAALDAAHQAGVIHRDFKPGNVMLVPEPESPGGVRAVVTDFGLALPANALPEGDQPRMTAVGLIVGTVQYMAPEQAEGRDLDARADVYAFGAVLFEMLTGRLPHTGESPVKLLMRRLSEPAPSPRAVLADIDPALDWVVRRCLDPNPRMRFASAGEAVDAIARGQVPPDAAAVTQALSSVPSALPRPARPRRWPWVTAALLALAVAAIVVIRRPAPPSPPGARPAPQADSETSPPPSGTAPALIQITTSRGLDTDASLSPDGSRIVFASDRTGQFEIHVQPVSGAGEPVRITSDGAQNVQPAWSPDGKEIAYHASAKGGVWIVPARGGPPRQLTSFGSRPAWSPDGKRIAFQSVGLVDISPYSFGAQPPSLLWTVPSEGGSPRPLTRAADPPGGHGSPAWSPDGKFVAFTVTDRLSAQIWRVPADGGPALRLAHGNRYSYDPVYLPDGRALLFCVAKVRLAEIWKVALDASGRPSGPETLVARVGSTGIHTPSVAARSGRVTYGALGVTSQLLEMTLDARSRAVGVPRALTTSTARDSRPVYSPDGSQIAFYRVKAGLPANVWLMNAGGGEQRELTSDPADDFLPSWFPDGRRIAFLSDRGGRWKAWAIDTASHREELLLDVPLAIDGMVLSPDGERIAFHARTQSAVNVWTARPGGQDLRQVTFEPSFCGFPSWSRDGKLLAVEVRRGDSTHVAVVSATASGTGGTALEVLTEEEGDNWPLGWSLDGSRIAFAAGRRGTWSLRWIDRRTRRQEVLWTETKPSVFLRPPAWSPDGLRLVFERGETTGNVWMIELEP